MNNTIIKILKNTLLNFLWVAMFIVLWVIEDGHVWRIFASLGIAFVLAIFQVLFETKDKNQ